MWVKYLFLRLKYKWIFNYNWYIKASCKADNYNFKVLNRIMSLRAIDFYFQSIETKYNKNITVCFDNETSLGDLINIFEPDTAIAKRAFERHKIKLANK